MKWTQLVTKTSLRGFFGVAQFGRTFVRFVLPVATVVAGAAFWAGQEWEQGREAQRDLRYAREHAEAHQREVGRLRKLAEDHEREREIARRAERASAEALRRYLANVDWDQCRLDADGLRLWNSWADPPGERAATGEPDAAVSGALAEGPDG